MLDRVSAQHVNRDLPLEYTMTQPNFCGRTRREMLWQAGSGFTGLALTAMMDKDGFFNNQAVAADGETQWSNPLASKEPHFAPKAKNVIFLLLLRRPQPH